MEKKLKSLMAAMVILGAFVIASPVLGEEWHNAKGNSVTWDPPTHLESGAIIPTDNQLKYRLYLKSRDAAPDFVPTLIFGETESLVYATDILGEEGFFHIGVSAVRMVLNSTTGVYEEVSESGITWSNSEDTAAVPIPFGLKSWLATMAPTGYRLTK